MSITAIYFIFAGLIFSVILFLLKQIAQRKAACFKMYAVRDSLILLVAENKLHDDSKVFQYYYGRVNSLLSLAPNIGVDDVAQTMLHMKNGDLDKALKKSKREGKQILALKEMECKEVRDVVENYYSASSSMIFSHSSFLRLVYITHIRSGFLSHYVKQVIPTKIVNRLKVIRFTQLEVDLIKKHA